MKCPDCGSDLNCKETAPVAGRGRIEATVCALCGNLAELLLDGGPARHVAACGSCGAPLREAAPQALRECDACREEGARGGAPVETVEEAGARVLAEALRLFPPLSVSGSRGYFEQVLGSLAAGAGQERSAYRLTLVSDLGFKTLSIPGGTILAGVELLCALEDEAMLAFMLAREIAHQQSGRVFRRFRARRIVGPLSAGFEWGMSLITGSGVAFGKRHSESVREVVTLGYGPSHEESADAFAVGLVVRMGYDPAGAVRCLALMEGRDRSARRPLAAFLEVLPAHSRRRTLAQALVAAHTDGATLVRLNLEVYRRAAASLTHDGVLARAGPRVAGRGTDRPS